MCFNGGDCQRPVDLLSSFSTTPPGRLRPEAHDEAHGQMKEMGKRVFLGVACVALWRLRMLIMTAIHATRRKKESDCAQGSVRIDSSKRLQE